MRKNIRKVILVSVLLTFVSSYLPAADGQICGRIFQEDKTTPAKAGEVRFVNTQTGEAKTVSVNDKGCYCSEKDVAPGSYSIVYNDGRDTFSLADKAQVNEKTTSAVCMNTGENNSLTALSECKICKGSPILPIILIGGGAGAAAAVVVTIGHGEEAVSSPSTPQ
jgi:hypothetical protein